MEEQKINQDQGRKQTAERLNFRFFFIFYHFFTVEGSFLVRTVKRRSVKTFFSTQYIFFLIFLLVYLSIQTRRAIVAKRAHAFHNRSVRCLFAQSFHTIRLKWNPVRLVVLNSRFPFPFHPDSLEKLDSFSVWVVFRSSNCAK